MCGMDVSGIGAVVVLALLIAAPITGWLARNTLTRVQWLLALLASLVLVVIGRSVEGLEPLGLVGVFGFWASVVGAIATRRGKS